ncbi:hypothetical protein BO70DRAFT_356237 [Aspergillus heteromorphus CBS 117.55]|uniref:Uncharacterized protein n=1 Tax=Aspergillus heteromorphus CBS 117.55 TaxID=1448321 RepID=A0A317V0Q1_9EURO|nr:uncharacterized protein BO70DRAFT_356237 [Aspergillus heteromorphus CBS 117.55]PWY67904.1 hypothetical protein BO70DRAFT_356237 [Aspergillus heteromorphus CBS 117.55]
MTPVTDEDNNAAYDADRNFLPFVKSNQVTFLLNRPQQIRLEFVRDPATGAERIRSINNRRSYQAALGYTRGEIVPNPYILDYGLDSMATVTLSEGEGEAVGSTTRKSGQIDAKDRLVPRQYRASDLKNLELLYLYERGLLHWPRKVQRGIRIFEQEETTDEEAIFRAFQDD